MRKPNYVETLCGLLHDIGKALFRYKLRAEDGVEEKNEVYEELLKDVKDHEEAAIRVMDFVIKSLPGHKSASYEAVCGPYEEVIRSADSMAASERGLGDYWWIKGEWKNIEKEIERKVGGIRYRHQYVPLLSPLWILIKTNYVNSIGPCGVKEYRCDEALKEYLRLMTPLIQALDHRDEDKIADELSRLIKELANESVWLAPQPLTKENILGLRGSTLVDASKSAKYSDISKWTVIGLKKIIKAFGGKASRGFIDTVDELLRHTVLTVPAAVYAALLSDTSLYSHSKVAAAYTSVRSMGIKTYKLMVLDARKIQEFVAAPVVAKAASRVIRGRSFLAELVSMSLLNYVLELYGGLPYSNVITSEGGTLTLIVPALIDEQRENELIKQIKEVVKETHSKLRGLWYTVALSKKFGLGDVDYIRGLKSCKNADTPRCSHFFEVLDSLEERLAIEKSLDDSRAVFKISEKDIEGFDAITGEPVVRDELDRFALRVNDRTRDYASAISGGKLQVGDIISEVTHLSLVAGTSLRNLIFLVSLYLYEDGEKFKPSDKVSELVNSLRKKISEKWERRVENFELYFGNVEINGCGYNIGLVPIPSLGSLHVPVSGIVCELRTEVIRNLLEIILEILQPVMCGSKEPTNVNLRCRLEVRLVNVGLNFVENLTDLANVMEKLLNMGVDIYVGALYTGTYHPTVLKIEKGAITGFELVDLDSYDLISLVKVDADSLGEVKKMLSFSPTRLASLSDLLLMVMTGKAHLKANEYSKRFAKEKPRGPIILYSGGDDIAFYGYWVDALAFLGELYKDVLSSLYPLSFTSAAAIEGSSYPLLELYRRVVGYLKDTKRECRGGVYVAEVSSPKPVKCDCETTECVCKIVECFQPYESGLYSGFKSTSPLEIFDVLAKTLEKLEERWRDLEAYKREMRLISQIASMRYEDGFNELKALCEPASLKELYSITKRLVALSYISNRREEDLRNLESILEDIISDPTGRKSVRIHHVVGDDIKESLLRVVKGKSFIDILLFYLSHRTRR